MLASTLTRRIATLLAAGALATTAALAISTDANASVSFNDGSTMAAYYSCNYALNYDVTYWNNGNVGYAFTPSAALLKATLINSAVSMTGTTAIPANCQGWGRVLLENALFFTGQATSYLGDALLRCT